MKTLFLHCVIGHCAVGCLLLSSAFANPPAAPAKVSRYAATVIQRHDTNGDKILQQEEWVKMPGTPQAIDLDGDQQITLDELVWYFSHYGYGRTIHRAVMIDLSEPYKFDPANLQLFRPVWHWAGAPLVSSTEAQEPPNDEMEKIMKANEQPIDDDVYQRMLEERQIPAARPYHVLPETLRGVPAWFVILDKNGDGQISLAEFAPTRAPATIRLFKRLDKNDNGFVEPDEARNP